MHSQSRLTQLAALIFGSTIGLSAGVSAWADVANVQLAPQVDAIFAKFDRPDSPGCAVGIVKDGAIIYARGYGQENLEYDAPITSKTEFYIASTTKQFTALSVLLASRQGFFSLDDTIDKYFPELPAYAKQIRVQHLIHHTSGIRDDIALADLAGLGEDGYTSEAYVMDLLARQKALNFPPGTKYSYSNGGYFLLGQLIKRTTGKTLREFSTENIFGPLGMKHTFYLDNHREIIRNRAQGHAATGKNTFEKVQTTYDLVGSGGLITTVEDLFLYDQNFYKNILANGDPTLLHTFLEPGLLNNGKLALADNSDIAYGYGLAVDKYRGHKQVHHSGGFIGFSAEYLRFPDDRFSVITLCNLANGGASELSHKIADLFLTDQSHASAASSVASALTPAADVAVSSLKRWVGRYWSEEYPFGLAEIKLHDNKLWTAAPGGWGPDVELRALSDHEFVSVTGVTAGGKYVFSVNGDGTNSMLMDITLFGKWSLHQIAAFTPARKDYEGLVGTYDSPELAAKWHFFIEGESLKIRRGYGAVSQAVEVMPDTYLSDGAVIHVKRGGDRSINGIRVDSYQIKGLEFVRE